MEQTSTETVVPDSNDETIVLCGEEFIEKVSQYVQQNPRSKNTKLFSFLVLLKVYIPESYLTMSECQKILGPPDPIHGSPPFEASMEPFTICINASSPEHVCMMHQVFAQKAVDLLARSGISRSATMKEFMISLCADQPEPHIIQFVQDLLTKREFGERGIKKFSRLIEDIQAKEDCKKALSVLETASDKFIQNPMFPQTISRLYYIRIKDYKRAEDWAKKAISRAPNNSYVADTLGQVYKNRLLRKAEEREDILNSAQQAFRAFKDVETKADREDDPEMEDTAGTVSISESYNNRGYFGFIQVAKITFEKLSKISSNHPQTLQQFIQKHQNEVEDKFEFFEWYLTYSKPDMTSLEPSYFWKDIVLCYEHFTEKTAAESTSFPGLLDCLNRGLFTSKGRHAGFEEAEETVSDLEATQDALKTTSEENVNDVQAVERYILSNIILSNKMHDSPQLTPAKELQKIIHRFLAAQVGHRSPEFCLLVLLLFWPEAGLQVVQDKHEEEVEHQATEEDGSEDQTCEDADGDEEQETRGEHAQLSLEVVFDPDLQQQVTFMERAFEGKYANYLRGRYLLPLFFLGKGSGLSKWIHKSRLDAIVEEKVNAESADEQGERMEEKWSRINEMWAKGEVWQIPEIQDILLPVQIEPCHSPTMPQEHEEEKVFVYAGEKKIMARVDVETDASAQSPEFFFLGFTIQGPVVFNVGFPQVSGQ